MKIKYIIKYVNERFINGRSVVVIEDYIKDNNGSILRFQTEKECLNYVDKELKEVYDLLIIEKVIE